MRRPNLISDKSGFKTVRDLLFFIVGIGIDIYHIATTAADKLSWQLLVFGAGVAGAPMAMNSSVGKRKDGDDSNEDDVEDPFEEEKPRGKNSKRPSRKKDEKDRKWADLPFDKDIDYRQKPIRFKWEDGDDG